MLLSNSGLHLQGELGYVQFGVLLGAARDTSLGLVRLGKGQSKQYNNGHEKREKDVEERNGRYSITSM